MSSMSSMTSMSSMSSSNENIDMFRLPPPPSPSQSLLVRDFGWPESSARYRGDHTQASNPDWEQDPLGCPQAREKAFQKMQVSYALYMANLGRPRPRAPKKKPVWTRFLPWAR